MVNFLQELLIFQCMDSIILIRLQNSFVPSLDMDFMPFYSCSTLVISLPACHLFRLAQRACVQEDNVVAN